MIIMTTNYTNIALKYVLHVKLELFLHQWNINMPCKISTSLQIDGSREKRSQN